MGKNVCLHHIAMCCVILYSTELHCAALCCIVLLLLGPFVVSNVVFSPIPKFAKKFLLIVLLRSLAHCSGKPSKNEKEYARERERAEMRRPLMFPTAVGAATLGSEDGINGG